MRKCIKVICSSLFLFVSVNTFSQSILLPVGHSHNDYIRQNPLFEALSYGFTSIEVDVFLHDNRMVVTHDNKNLNEKPTIQELYLDPLRLMIKENNGTIFINDSTQLVLMVDLKSEKVATYQALKSLFEKYKDLIEWYQGEKVIWGPIKVLLTGGPPVDLIEKEENRYFYVDGSIDQWSEDYPVNLMPRASTNYRNYFKWFGKGEISVQEEKKLRELITKAHAAGRNIRFWGSPNKPKVWEKLLDEGADWINVDDLKGFSEFYRLRIGK